MYLAWSDQGLVAELESLPAAVAFLSRVPPLYVESILAASFAPWIRHLLLERYSYAFG